MAPAACQSRCAATQMSRRSVSYVLSSLMNLKRDQERAAWLQAADTPLLEGDFFEQIIRAIYTAILQPGDLAVDCGANVGLHTMPMSNLVGPSGRVLAIEAIPEMAESLAFHTRGGSYTNIEVVPKAIGSREGRATFSWVKGLPGWSGLRQRADLSPGLETSVATIEVPITTLDSLLANSRHRVRFVKMDLEGGEYHALQGAASMLKNHRPLVIFENGREPDCMAIRAKIGLPYSKEQTSSSSIFLEGLFSLSAGTPAASPITSLLRPAARMTRDLFAWS